MKFRRTPIKRGTALRSKLGPHGASSSTERIVHHLTHGILTGRYVPGQWLVEADVTNALHVSRGPVREAFRRLDALGILSRTMYRGACVRLLTRAEAIDLMAAAEGMDRMTARLAAAAVRNRIANATLRECKRALQPYRDREYDLAGAPQLRQQFYDILIRLTGNSQLPSLFPTMRIHLLRLQTQMYRGPHAARSDVDDFAAVALAVLQGDANAAERASCRHHRRIQKSLVDMPDEAFARAPATDSA